MSAIIQIDEDAKNPLRSVSVPVKASEFNQESLRKILEDMKIALDKEHDGVALAAPQIGVSKRIFIVSEKAYHENAKWKPLVFINPEITKASKKLSAAQEGCLSVRWIYGTTSRSESVTVRAQNENGVPFSFGASGLIAQIFQHEIDHLNGILFIDHGYDLEEFNELEIREAEKARDTKQDTK